VILRKFDTLLSDYTKL